ARHAYRRRYAAPATTTIHIRAVGVNLVRSTLDGCIVVRSMRSSSIVLGCPVRPDSRVAYPRRILVFLANCYLALLLQRGNKHAEAAEYWRRGRRTACSGESAARCREG